MNSTASFGPNTESVKDFLAELNEIPWFTRTGQPCEQDGIIERVDIHFLLGTNPIVSDADTNEYMHWGSSLPEAESKIERLIFEHKRLDDESALRRAIKLPPDRLDEFYLHLTDQFDGYYGATNSYVHELIEPPMRLLRGVALEIMVADLDPNLTFFQSLLPFFRSGLWPCGWQGSYPAGKLIVW